MSTACPNGHDSEWPDWCSVCGERLAAASAAPAAPAPTASRTLSPTATPAAAAVPAGPTCDNCGVVRREDDVFCESCGYDFASGSLPEATGSPATGSAAPDGANSSAPMHARVSVDLDFFNASVGDVELTLPDPVPDPQVVPLAGIRILIGRTSSSRGIFPEIDVRALTDDPAVSSRHAMLERDASTNWTLTDLGSTNGTFLTPAAEKAIDAGTAHPIAAGTTIYLGAWTRIVLAETSA